MTKSFDRLESKKKTCVLKELKRKTMTQPILIATGGYILASRNNVAMQELEMFVSQFVRNQSNKLSGDFDKNVGGVTSRDEKMITVCGLMV